jgi:DNA-binding transcriptional ArsR family regulator
MRNLFDGWRTMSYSVSVEWAPAYELTISLLAYSKQNKTLELPPGWATEARARGGAALDELVQPECGQWLDIVVWRCPGPRDAPGFIAWLEAVPLGDLYTLLAPCAESPHFPLPDDLATVRAQWVQTLTVWHAAYFQHVDPAMLAGLAAEAEARRELIAQQDPMEAVEAATNGIEFFAPKGISQVLLVPQYHYRPINLYQSCRGWRHFHYPTDALPPTPGAPPDALLRLTRGLDDASRLQMLRFLASGERSFTEIVEASGLAKSTVHHHLVLLRAAGLVRGTDRGAGAVSFRLRPTALDDLARRLADYTTPERDTP